MESLFYGMFGPIGALAVIMELIEYAELFKIFVQRQRRRQKKNLKESLCYGVFSSKCVNTNHVGGGGQVESCAVKFCQICVLKIIAMLY